MNPWRVLKYMVVLALVGGGGYLYLWYRAQSISPADALAVATVERRDLAVKVTAAGGVAPRHKALITPPYDGYIRKLYVKIGDKVKVGAPIVTIAQTIGGTSEKLYPLRSSLNGTVVQVWRTQGERVSQTPPGTNSDPTIVRIDDLSELFIEANVAEIDIDKLRLGQPALIRALALPGRIYEGRIVEISLAAKEQDRWERARVEFPVTVAIKGDIDGLKPGMSGVLDIIVQEAKGVLTLPQEFVLKDGDRYVVTLADGRTQAVEVGLQSKDAFEIKSGLHEGDRVRQVDFQALPPPPGEGG